MSTLRIIKYLKQQVREICMHAGSIVFESGGGGRLILKKSWQANKENKSQNHVKFLPAFHLNRIKIKLSYL